MESIYPFVHVAAAAVFPVAMAYAGLSDLCRFRIPNWVSLAVAISFLPAAVAAGWDLSAMLLNLGAGAAVLAAGLFLFTRGILGGGDAKLLAAAAAWIGWGGLPGYLLAVALAGGGLALAILGFRRLKLPAALATVGWVRRLHGEEPGVPYGLAIAAGAIALFPSLPVVTAAATR